MSPRRLLIILACMAALFALAEAQSDYNAAYMRRGGNGRQPGRIKHKPHKHNTDINIDFNVEVPYTQPPNGGDGSDPPEGDNGGNN